MRQSYEAYIVENRRCDRRSNVINRIERRVGYYDRQVCTVGGSDDEGGG